MRASLWRTYVSRKRWRSEWRQIAAPRRKWKLPGKVQARLFPQKLPAMKTLEYTGACIQARKVGGDYYDFLELRPGRLALVLADIAGKGVSGALLMANLQANLRSQYAMAVDDLPRLLASVNRLFYESSDDASYATLFFADYDDSSRKLRYANCGHLPPLLLRAEARRIRLGGPKVERLRSTCTVMGLFEDLALRDCGSAACSRRHAGALHGWSH